MLNGGGVQPGTDIGEQSLAFFSLDTIDAYLDQFVRLQAAVNLSKDAFAEAVLADAGDGMQAVGAGAQRPAQG